MYISEIKDGARRMIRTPTDVAKKEYLRRKAPNPGPAGRVILEYSAA